MTAGNSLEFLESLSETDVTADLNSLVELIDWHLPIGVYPPDDEWFFYGHGLLARMRDCLHSIALLVPSHRESDSLILVRSLYEYVVTFCWLAIDPEQHMREWENDAIHSEIKIHNEAARFGVEVLSPEEIELAQSYEARRMTAIADRASQSTDYWAERITGLRPADELLSLRGLYLAIFRRASEVAHASMNSIHPLLARPTPGSVARIRRESSTRLFWPAISAPLFAHALMVSADQFDWPSESQLQEVLGLKLLMG